MEVESSEEILINTKTSYLWFTDSFSCQAELGSWSKALSIFSPALASLPSSKLSLDQ